MNIKIDFDQNKSLGNVYEKTIINNFESFEAARQFYRTHKSDLNKSIIDAMNMGLPPASAGSSVTIPTTIYPDRGFINSLTFNVISRTEEEIIMALTNVGH